MYKFNEAISFQVNCDSQYEVDFCWAKLSAGGMESLCGWLKDQFGVSWQVNPTAVTECFDDADPAKASRSMQAMLKMTKLNIAEFQRP